MSDDPDLEIPAFLKVGTPENDELRARPIPPRSTPPTSFFVTPAAKSDPAIDAILAEQEREKKIRAKNRIAKMLAKKQDHTGQRWDCRICKWVPINGAKKVISIQPRTYARESDALRGAQELLGRDTPVEVRPLPSGRFAFVVKQETAQMKMPTKTAAGAPGVARQFQIDPARVYSVKSNARRDAKKAGLDPDKVVVAGDGGTGFKIVASATLPKAAQKPPKAAQKPAKAAKAVKATKAPAKPRRAPTKPRAGKNGQSKREIVAELLRRPEGATREEILEATGWPSVTVPGQAAASGLALRVEKNKGEKTRYFGTPIAA